MNSGAQRLLRLGRQAKPGRHLDPDSAQAVPGTPAEPKRAADSRPYKAKPKRTRESEVVVLRHAWSELKGWRRWLAVIMALKLIATPLGLLSPLPLAIAIDSGLGGQPLPAFLGPFLPDALRTTVWLLALAGILQVLVVVLTGVHSWASSLAETWVSERITLRLRGRMLARAQQLSFSYHDRTGTADSIYRIQYDAPSIAQLGIYGVLPYVSAAVMLLSMLGVVWAISPVLALVSLSVTPGLVISTHVYRVRMKPRYRQVKLMESDALKVVQEVLSAFRVVKAFAMEEEEEKRFIEHSGLSAAQRVSIARAEGIFSIVNNAITATGTGLVIVLGGLDVAAGRMTVGSLVMVISYLGQLFGPLQTLTNQPAKMQSFLVSAERALQLLHQPPEVQDPPDGISVARAPGAFELRRVTFGYAPESPVLQDVNVELPAGSRVGIIGRTGAGKSTLINLLMRFYDVGAGGILLDGTDLRHYRLGDLRRQFSMVPQDPFLFSTSIRENIAYSRPEASLAQIVAAARAADIHDFVMTLPEGYDTLVGERGMRLSGGERQRMSLARAFLRDAPILLLDEPTSSVDQDTEASILEAMERLMAGRTTFIVAHRLTTLRTCDVILRVGEGHVVPVAPHEVLTLPPGVETPSSVGSDE